MMKKLIILFLVLIVITGCGREKADKEEANGGFTLISGDYDLSLVHGGLEREYKVHVPPIYNKDSSTPVVIYIHGGGGSSDASKNDGMHKYSDKYGFILLSPAGTGVLKDKLLTWNCGERLIEGIISEICTGYSFKNNIDDVGFISKMIEEVKKDFNINENKVYATGISQGGAISYMLACELSDKIAAIAPVAPAGIPINCNPSRPVPAIHIHGTADPCIPYNGGIGAGCLSSEQREVQSAEEVIGVWRNLNKCSSDYSVAYNKGKASCISYDKCVSDVEFCTVEDMGHTYPSGKQYLPERRIGPVSYDISFEQIWGFFVKHPLK